MEKFSLRISGLLGHQGQQKVGVRKHQDIHAFLLPALGCQKPGVCFLKGRLEDPALQIIGKDVHIVTWSPAKNNVAGHRKAEQ